MKRIKLLLHDVLSTSKLKPSEKFVSDKAKKSLNNTSTTDEGNLHRLLNFGGNKIAAHRGNGWVQYHRIYDEFPTF